MIVVVDQIAVRAVAQATDTVPIVLVGDTSGPVAPRWIEQAARIRLVADAERMNVRSHLQMV